MSKPSYSVIICSIEAGKFARVSENYKTLLAGYPFEIIGIHDAHSLAEGYNRGIARSSGDILIFSHDDILILDRRFADKITERLKSYQLLGFVGSRCVVNGTWFGAGQPHIRGLISHARPGERQLSIDLFGVEEWPVAGDMQVMDGLCLIARRDAVGKGFDSETFDGFHLYDLDFTLGRHLAGCRLGVICDIPIVHESAGRFDDAHQIYASRFCDKYAEQIRVAIAASNITRPDARPNGKRVVFDEPAGLMDAWQQNVLHRATIGIYRNTSGSSILRVSN